MEGRQPSAVVLGLCNLIFAGGGIEKPALRVRWTDIV